MELTRRGLFRNRGTRTLANVKLDSPPPSWVLKWVADDRKLLLRMDGRDDKAQYQYKLQFSADELALFIETVLIGASQDGAIHAQAKAMGNYIREVLDKKNKPAAPAEPPSV
jgi:hypothetical protein